MVDTRSALLLEAERLVRARGYAGFSYADLSATVGVTKASIHHHFPTKEELVATALDAYSSRYAALIERIEANHACAVDRILQYARLYLSGAEQRLGCLCAALTLQHDRLPAALRGRIKIFFDEHLAWLERVYAEGLERGEIADRLAPREAARVILSCLEGALLIERTRDEHEFELVVAGLRAILLIGNERSV